MAKKYRYRIGKSADGYTTGTIVLTKKEASIIAYALDTDNWDNLNEESFSGSMWIDIENPIELVE